VEAAFALSMRPVEESAGFLRLYYSTISVIRKHVKKAKKHQE
jgi:hypothetical protein